MDSDRGDAPLSPSTSGQVAPDEIPRLVAWLRSARPTTTSAEVVALLAAVPSDRVRRLERVLDDLARSCRPPGRDDLAALAALDDLLAGGPSV